MKKNLLLLGQLACVILLVAACAGESNLPTANGSASFRIVNAIPTSPSIALLIEERAVSSADYKGASAPSDYDNLQYTFNFEAFLPGQATRTRIASVPVDTQRDLSYTFLASGNLATPTITLWETPRREWASTETVFEVRFAHAAESLGDVDVYFQAPGVVPVLGDQIASPQFTNLSATVELPAGDYVLIIKTQDDPNDILFTSATLTPTVAAGHTFALFDADANDVDPIAVRQLPDTGGSVKVVDENSMSTVRFYHASSNLETSDVYTDEMLMDQILANHMYRDVTAELPLAADTYTLTYTMAGNVGSILLEDDVTIVKGNKYEYYTVGETGTVDGFLHLPDRRSVETLVKFSFLHTATNHDAVDLYIVTSGTDIATTIPHFVNLAIGSPPVNASLQAGDFELYLTPNGEKTVLAGPVAFSPVLGDIVYYIDYDNVDPAIADIVEIPLP
jgi:hypothetical protein